MPAIDSPTPQPVRRQFTLRSIFRLIAILTIIASWCISYRLYRENKNLRQENTRLWGEVGELHVAEGTEDKLQAIGVPTTDDMVWKWHVHVPNRQNFFLSLQVGKIAEDVPDRISGLNLYPGEYLVTAAFRKDFQDRWQWLVKQEPDGGRGRAGASIGDFASDEQVKLALGPHSMRSSHVDKGICFAEPGKPLPLLRYRLFAQEPYGQMRHEPAEGVLVWVCEGQPTFGQ